jgi:hypothetical protein
MPGTAFTTTLDTLPQSTGEDQPGAIVVARAGKKKAPGPSIPQTDRASAAPCQMDACQDKAVLHSEACRQFIFCIESWKNPCFCHKHFAAVSMKRMEPPGRSTVGVF